MKIYGAHRSRIAALMLTVVMLISTCFTPAYAAVIWDELILSLTWTDSYGQQHAVPASQVNNDGQLSYWARLDASALGQMLTAEIISPDPAYTFYFLDDWGSQTSSFTWMPEMDALNTSYEFAHVLFYAVNGVQADMPILLYVSTIDVPREESFQPFPVQVRVNYVTEDGDVLDTQYVECWAGETTSVWAGSGATAGYQIVGADWAEVTVDRDGNAAPREVTFRYRAVATPTPVPTEVPTPSPVPEFPVPVVYLHVNGKQLDFQEVRLAPGDHVVYADSRKVEGYVPAGDTAVRLTVSPDGNIDIGSVVFYYEDAYVAPAEATITVNYIHIDRGLLDAQSITLTEGTHTVREESHRIGGYERLGDAEVSVTVYADGSVHPGTVDFYYQDVYKEPVTAQLDIVYRLKDGTHISSDRIALNPGSHTISADEARMGGYVLEGSSSHTVHVDEDGALNPDTVTFTLRQAEAVITVRYQDEFGGEVAPSQRITLTGEGNHVIRANPEGMKAGYELVPGLHSQVNVSVWGGVPSQAEVVFYYQKAKTEPTGFTLPVNYYDTLRNQIAETQYVSLAPGSYSIQANPWNLPEGYELEGENILRVTVFQDGSTDPEEIAFYYSAPQTGAAVIVTYTDEWGIAIAQPFTVELEPGYHTILADENRVPRGYDPASARPVQVVVTPDGKANPSQVVLSFRQEVVETPIPVGQNVNRYAGVNRNSIALRTEPTQSGGDKTVIRRLGKNEKVYVLKELRNSKNEVWAHVIVNGREGYMMSQYLDIMTQADSDAYAYGSTPVPTFTPEAAVTPTPTPTVTPQYKDPLVYTGYALTSRATALHTGVSTAENTIIQRLEQNELLYVQGQVTAQSTGEVWAFVSTLNKQPGYVPFSVLRPITEQEAQPYLAYWEEMNKTPVPTQAVTATPEPMQVLGYAVVLGDDVPFRLMPGEYSRIIDNLQGGTVVYVTGQTAGDGQYWHSVNYEGRWGYIRTDLVRMMTIAEEENYLQAQQATPTPATTNQPFNEAGLSSYGYVDCEDNSSVNWRENPSKSSKKIGSFRRYALCTVLGTERRDGVTWYYVSYDNKTGYIHGDYFYHMSISETLDFLDSEEHLQGIVNNAASGESAKDDAGYTGPGGMVSWEDQIKHENPETWVTAQPWSPPVGTVAPIASATPTLEPLPGWVAPATATPSPSPTATPTFNPLPDVTYPVADQGDGGTMLVWLVVGGLLLLCLAGVFALARQQQNKRRMALRAAQRRAQAARAQQLQRPYRPVASNQPRTGTYANPAQRQGHDGYESRFGTYPRSDSDRAGAYFRPADDAAQETSADAPRVGRRTAYRQSQRKDGGDTFGM